MSRSQRLYMQTILQGANQQDTPHSFFCLGEHLVCQFTKRKSAMSEAYTLAAEKASSLALKG